MRPVPHSRVLMTVVTEQSHGNRIVTTLTTEKSAEAVQFEVVPDKKCYKTEDRRYPLSEDKEENCQQ
jgi:nicotinamide mononucleotide adenylyltransferase